MKREIKFRIKNNDNNWIIFTPFHNGLNVNDFKTETLSQYIEHKDINEKEIYEGDVVKYYQPYAKRWDTHIVKWDADFAGFGLFENNNKYCKESDWVKIKDIEVIGNIYENPELL